MNIFISWSGNRSKQVALLLKEWISSVIQLAKPWVSDDDINRGAQWFTEISNVLADCKIGIVCLTEENKNNPWILFESGALVKGLSENRLCTFLIDLKPTDIEPPLSQFNHTEATNESLLKLVKTINDTAGENKLAENVLTRVFNIFYPVFEEEFKSILANTPVSKQKPTKSQSELLEEVLLTVRNIEKETYARDSKLLEAMRLLHSSQLENNAFYHTRYKQELEKRTILYKNIGENISGLDKIRKQFANQKSEDSESEDYQSTDNDRSS